MFSCSPPHNLSDKEDAFDWESAMREIDVVCTSNAEENKATIVCNHSSDCNCNLGAPGVSPSSSNQDARNGDSFNWSIEKKIDRKSNSEDNDIAVSEPEHEDMGTLKIDPDAAKNWIYPVNVPRRDYQFAITRTSLFSNTLVVLPTGLGKTLVAAVVMYNYFRWFPEGKIVFAAPSRPLVLQQIQACHKIVGIPQEWTIDLTGQTNPMRRADLWNNKRVFFVTPQVLEKDIHSGSCVVKQLVCVVIDEAHRAMGNYSYCVAVRELMGASVQLRILALTATPGYKKQTIQRIIDNLQISSIEYRTESDPDVVPYVHNRKIDLIEVAMGDAAAEINSLLLEVVRPFVARLSALGVLHNRDLETLSSCHLLGSRDKFREERSIDLPTTNYGEVEGYFGILITLYHIRKLLSAHGIHPAFEMLNEKLKQGSFARFMSRNEGVLKAKLLMEQTISIGAHSPKLAKLLDVLMDHFKIKDPRSSRVIIFSNFRGSVREILNALRKLGDFVKATEFIGQSSGKTMKGQSQKAQQAVLEKFRAGGYNIIVATSIGEEGLDIMEVDLVICFDSNVSPLRMIQRMGRTGRQHEGRVVVLACEGPELKGYMTKQTNSKGIKKHLKNGGTKSFNFHSSPRMVPHVFNPEVQFLEMSIQAFVHRQKKVKDDSNNLIHERVTKLTDSETLRLAKYFSSFGEIPWKPSIIAFPQFQAFPSPVNKLAHSCRSGVLVDVMKHLQTIKFSRDNKTRPLQEDYLSDSSLRDEVVGFCDEAVEDSEKCAEAVEDIHKHGELECSIELERITKYNHHGVFYPTNSCQDAKLFDSKLPLQIDAGGGGFQDHEGINMQNVDNRHQHSSCQEAENFIGNHKQGHSGSPMAYFPRSEEICCSPDFPRIIKGIAFSSEEDAAKLIDDHGHNLEESDFSPRLISFIESGIVPESPLTTPGTHRGIPPSVVVPSPSLQRKLFTKPFENGEDEPKTWNFSKTNVQSSDICRTEMSVLNSDDEALASPSTSVEKQRKYKRLFKSGERKEKKCSPVRNKETVNDGQTERVKRGHSVEKRWRKRSSIFIEDEADVSLNATDSSTEDEQDDNSLYEDNFIDDGLDPTSQQAGVACSKMMAIYRQSLLSQSLFRKPDTSASKSDHDYSSVKVQVQTGLESTARNCRIPCTSESRKRKSCFSEDEESFPRINLDINFISLTPECQEPNTDIVDDDMFFQGIDLDAVEKEAANIIQHKSEFSRAVSQPDVNRLDILCSPSFDLGI